MYSIIFQTTLVKPHVVTSQNCHGNSKRITSFWRQTELITLKLTFYIYLICYMTFFFFFFLLSFYILSLICMHLSVCNVAYRTGTRYTVRENAIILYYIILYYIILYYIILYYIILYYKYATINDTIKSRISYRIYLTREKISHGSNHCLYFFVTTNKQEN